jgi:hypothetical protein
MRISNHFREIVAGLRLLPHEEIRGSMPHPELEQPDIVSVFALAAALREAYGRVDGPNGLSYRNTGDGGMGVMQAAIDFAWVFECVACEVVDWELNSEVWAYWLEDHAEEILALTGEEPDEEFKDRVRKWLGEQEASTLRQ